MLQDRPASEDENKSKCIWPRIHSIAFQTVAAHLYNDGRSKRKLPNLLCTCAEPQVYQTFRPQEKDQLRSVHFFCKQTTTFGAFITHLVMSLFTNYDYYTDLYQSCLVCKFNGYSWIRAIQS